MAHRSVHLLEAGIVTEQRFAGVAEAPAALGPAVAKQLQPEKRIRVPFYPRDRWLTAAREACILLSDAVCTSLTAGARVGILGGECTLVAGSGGAASPRRSDAERAPAPSSPSSLRRATCRRLPSPAFTMS